MAKKKQGGKTTQHVSPEGKRLGLKVGAGEKVSSGSVLVRQRGKVISAGEGAKMGRDYTLYAVKEGVVTFGKKLGKKIVKIVPKT
jgi:large subunit ribosomal protein L27